MIPATAPSLQQGPSQPGTSKSGATLVPAKNLSSTKGRDAPPAKHAESAAGRAASPTPLPSAAKEVSTSIERDQTDKSGGWDAPIGKPPQSTEWSTAATSTLDSKEVKRESLTSALATIAWAGGQPTSRNGSAADTQGKGAALSASGWDVPTVTPAKSTSWNGSAASAAASATADWVANTSKAGPEPPIPVDPIGDDTPLSPSLEMLTASKTELPTSGPANGRDVQAPEGKPGAASD